MPIGVIVAIAIICIVVAVVSSARRADDVTIGHERELLSHALDNIGDRVLRETESVVTSDAAIARIRTAYDETWVRDRVGLWLETFFNHDYVAVFDGADRPMTTVMERKTTTPDRAAALVDDLRSILAYMRGRSQGLASGRIINHPEYALPGAVAQVAIVSRVLGRPAIIAAVGIGPKRGILSNDDTAAPIVVSVRLIDEEVVGEIARQLRLSNLRRIEQGPVPPGDVIETLAAPDGGKIGLFAWTPKQPGAEIVSSVIPFILIALAGFALLACFVMHYMRRTAATIAAGETRLRHLAMHDPLCGLPNRIFFGERLESMIAEVKAGAPSAALFYIDLDHFKDVNDTLGHPVGDELIRNVTLRLSHALRSGDLVARLGGDEFAVISTIGDNLEGMQALAQRIIAAICAPYSINRQNIVIGASIGIAIIDRQCGGAADIMRYADMALYRAKNEGRNRACVYDAAMDADLSNRKNLESELREAIENDGLRVLYQPIVDKSGTQLAGVEALCRWTHPTRGEISPAEFIPVAEHSGLIIELGAWVLRRACLDGANWPGLTVAVNVSPLQFRRTDFVSMVERTLRETGFDPKRLELELTESVLLGNVDTAEAAMKRLRAMGIRIALDDFGTGYSSLMYLRSYPFDKLKIDRSFVSSIEKTADAAAIVHAIVSLGRGLGMKVTAEGVETADQHLFLRAAGVHFMQGWRFGRPMTVEKITERLSQASTSSPDSAALAG